LTCFKNIGKKKRAVPREKGETPQSSGHREAEKESGMFYNDKTVHEGKIFPAKSFEGKRSKLRGRLTSCGGEETGEQRQPDKRFSGADITKDRVLKGRGGENIRKQKGLRQKFLKRGGRQRCHRGH